jgi:hypothetical protein
MKESLVIQRRNGRASRRNQYDSGFWRHAGTSTSIEDYGDLGRVFRETDIAEADHDTIVRNMISGEYEDPLRVVAFNTVEGWSRDVSEEIAYDVLDRAYDADTTLSAGAKRFIDRHVTPSAKRPPAPSVLRQPDQSARKKA